MKAAVAERGPGTAPPSPLMIPEYYSAELRLLLALLRSSLRTGDGRDVRAPVDAVNWGSVVALARRHRVGSFLHHRLPAPEREALPREVRAELSLSAERVMRRALQRAAELARIVQALEADGIAVASVKGPVLALQLYGGLGERHAGDLDLVVAPADVERADRLLRALGYERTEPDFELSPRQHRAHLRFHRENKYRCASSGIRIELKWRLFGTEEGLGPERAWQEVAGRRIATPAPAPNALYLFGHGARHGWFRLFWLVDAALLLRGGSVDWDRVARDCGRMGARRALLQGSALARDLLAVAPPAALAGGDGECRWVGRLASLAKRRISGEVHSGEDPPEPMGYVMLLQDQWRERWSLLRSRFMYARNWRILPLPDRWFALHYAAAPALWLYRRVARTERPSP